MFSFQGLDVYKKASQFHIDCKKLIADYKPDKYVAYQLERASYSIPLNIAEGSGKFSKPDRKNYYTTARASAFECASILQILCAGKIITESEFTILNDLCEEVSRMLFKMITNLQV